MNLAVLIPSRGLVFSETIDEVLREVAPFQYQVFFSHARPIPDCFNEPLDRILDNEFTHVWIVEEDMVLPKGILQELINLNAEVATTDYPPTEGTKCIQYDADGNILYSGTGCILIQREVFELMEKPLFRTDHIYTPQGKLLGKRDKREKIYGQHDVYFFMQLHRLGVSIKAASTECRQRKIVEYGAHEVNDGYHKIKII